MSPTQHILDLDREGLVAELDRLGEKPYRADQILQWIYDKLAVDFEAMSNLSKDLRARLTEEMTVYTSEVEAEARATDGTVKLLLRWPDGAASECVLIPGEGRQTACLSTQVGCPVGCAFCASGADGLHRSLSTGEIVEQALRLELVLRGAGLAASGPGGGSTAERSEPLGVRRSRTRSRPDTPPSRGLTHLVLMGLGEPLANYDSTLAAVQTLNAPWGLTIGARRITISTVGLPGQIRRLATEGLQVGLAISLHAPNDELRRAIVPWAERISIDDILDAARDYFELTGREVTLEYVLLGGVNDRPRHARQLAALAKQLRCNVNLIRFNPVADLPYERPGREDAHRFQEELRRAGVNTHLRASRGASIDAACGQLRRRHLRA